MAIGIAVLITLVEWSAAYAPVEQPGTVAVVYDWKAREGKIEEYNRYIR